MRKVDVTKEPFQVKRGQIYLADLGTREDKIGSEQFGVRPVCCTQSDFLNRKSPTVIVAIITSELKKVNLDTHILIPPQRGLPRQSMLCAEQRFTIDKQRLLKYCCTLPPEVMENVTRACHRAEEAEKKRRKFKSRRG